MECEHCCYACTTHGQDMSLKTFRKALKYDEIVSIGGGEPTIHPKFWEILGLAIGNSEYVWLATNGKKTDIAIALAKLAQKGVIGCDLSQDSYHEPIDEEVVQAFTKNKKAGIGGYYSTDNNDARSIRNVTGKEIISGRCDFGDNKGCVCPELFCAPDGTIKGCGCIDAPVFGNINAEVNIPDEWQHGECYKDQQ